MRESPTRSRAKTARRPLGAGGSLVSGTLVSGTLVSGTLVSGTATAACPVLELEDQPIGCEVFSVGDDKDQGDFFSAGRG
jgi:hypothetical protein